MTLQEIFDQFSFGELSQLSIGGQPQGVINESNWDRMVAHVNLALTTLYKRFDLKKGDVLVQLLPGQTAYRLHSDNSVLNPRFPSVTKFILDTASARFKNDVLKIERALTDDGFDCTINDAGYPYSLSTPALSTLEVPKAIVDQASGLPEELKTEKLRVIYRADHPKILMSGSFMPDRLELELPYTHLEALLWFVASRIHNPIGMGQEFNAGNTYYAKFEAECAKLQNEGLEINQNADGDRIHSKGWV